jgi:hypothetical protein
MTLCSSLKLYYSSIVSFGSVYVDGYRREKASPIFSALSKWLIEEFE